MPSRHSSAHDHHDRAGALSGALAPWRKPHAVHVVEVTDLLDLTGWSPGMRVIVRRERPHPGAQPQITDAKGWRIKAFVTNTRPGGPGTQLLDLSGATAVEPAPRTGSGRRRTQV